MGFFEGLAIFRREVDPFVVFNLHQPEFGLLTCTAAVQLSSSEVFAPQTHKETGAGGDDDIWGHGDVPPGDSLFWG